MIGNEEDFTACLGFEVPETIRRPDVARRGELQKMIDEAVADVPELHRRRHHPARAYVARRSTTGARSPGRAAAGFVEATHRPGLEIFDRVGGGDSFASGLIYGLLTTGGSRTWRSSTARRTARWR